MERTFTPSQRRPLALLGAALVLGILGEYLFSPGLLGVNVLLWTAALAISVLGLARLLGEPLRGEGRWLLAPALLFAGFVAWRSSPVLQTINVAAVASLLAIASFRLRDGKVRVGAVTEYLWLAMFSLVATATGLFELLFRRLDAATLWKGAGGGRLKPYVRGALIAAPFVAIFGALLASADRIFSDALAGALTFEAGHAAAHLSRALLWTWLSAGFLHGALVREPEPLPDVQPAAALRLGPIEVSTLLGAIDLLFLAFVAFQVRYLFGGPGHVEVTDGLTYAQYARHGFFELLAVAALVLPLVLGVHWLLRDRSPVLRIAFRVFAAALILLLYAIIGSALQRMRVYVDEFGLTELRLYTTAVMLWLVIVFAWLGATVLRDHRQRFASGAFAAGLFLVAALNALNPDAFIVRSNLERAERRDFDVDYAVDLSPDATPTLAANASRLSSEARCELAKGLPEPDDGGWRAWNHSREAARDASEELAGTCTAR